jgi:DNA mismatch endonuclease (patch repair protein)
VAVFIDGCFWHGCPHHGVTPKANRDWWRAKLDANRRRDADTDAHLRGIGWSPLRFWEHEPATDVADVIEREVRGRRGSSSHSR